MGEMYHDLSGPKDNHIAYGLSFPNQVAMETWQNEIDGQTPEDRHLGKTVRVLDTGREFMFIQREPELVFQALDARAPLLDDLDLYIDGGAAGNDLTGDGSSGAPYKTFTRAFQVLGNKQIDHVVKIRPKAGDYTEHPENVYLDIRPGGSVVVDASGEPYPVVSGPHTIGTVAGVGPQNPFGNYEATDLTVTPDPGWTPDEFYGKFIRFTSGNYTNRVMNVWKNNGDTIRIMMDFFTFQVGDTFEIVDCPVKVEVDHPIRFINVVGAELQISYFTPQFVVAGVEFQIDSGTTDFSCFNITGMSAIMTYTKLLDMWDADAYSIPLNLNGAGLNLDFLIPGTLDNTELEEWLNYSNQIISLGGTSPTEVGIDIVLENTSYAGWCGGTFCRRYVFLASTSGYLSFSFVGGFITFFGPNNVSPIASGAWLNVVYVEQIDYDAAAFVASGANFGIIEAYIEKSGQPIDMAFNSYVQADWLHGNAIATTHAAKIGPASTLHIPTEAYVTILGTVGAIEWTFDGSTVAAWPTAGNFVQKVDSYVSTKA